MAKEWVLNIAFNRWQFNRPKYVGKLSEAIRECRPKKLKDWIRYYEQEVPKKHVPSGWQKLGETMNEHLEEIGRRLYCKISEQLKAEIEEVTERDCIEYVKEVVLNRTFDGYMNERKTVYEMLERELKVKLEPAPDEWDRKYNVDFFIEVNGKFIGIQIKPTTYEQVPETHKWKEWMKKSHERFQSEIGGEVFIVFSVTKGKQKKILNTEIVEEIRREIERLKNS